jgi:hypothetical protein
MHVGEYEYIIASTSGDPLDVEWKVVKYTWVDLIEALIQHLKELRDKNLTPSLGWQLGDDDPLTILLVVMGDHGGDSMKFSMTMLAYEGADQKHIANLGSFEERETHDLLKNCVAPQINEAIGRLNKLCVIIVEWGNDQWDFILVPRSTLLHQGPRRGATGSCQQNDHDLSGLLPEEWGIGIHLSATAAANTLIVKWIDDDGEQQEKTLDRTDIPIRNAVQPLTFRFLEVTVSLNGDFKFTFCCAGRPNHDTSKCLKCDRIKSDWKEGYCKGCLYTLQNMQKDRDDYIAANAPPPQNETIAATVTRAELKTLGDARVKQTGIKDLEEIFTNIEGKHWGSTTTLQTGSGEQHLQQNIRVCQQRNRKTTTISTHMHSQAK